MIFKRIPLKCTKPNDIAFDFLRLKDDACLSILNIMVACGWYDRYDTHCLFWIADLQIQIALQLGGLNTENTDRDQFQRLNAQ